MPWSVRSKVLLVAAVGALLVALCGGLALLLEHRSSRQMTAIDRSVQALHAAGLLDMMHDALRADVYRALVAEPSEMEAVRAELAEHQQVMREQSRILVESADDARLRHLLEPIPAQVQSYMQAATTQVELGLTVRDVARAQVATFQTEFERLEGVLAEPGELIEQMSGQSVADGHAASALAVSLLAWGLPISLLLLLGVGLLVARSIPRPFLSVIAALRAESQQLVSASDDIAGQAERIAHGTSSQAASIEQASSSLTEITANTKAATTMAEQARDAARSASGRAADGRASAASVSASVGDGVRQLRQAVEQIDQSAKRTAGVVDTIDDISFQINLLALNAAVEAARAGDAGAGFAVVAEEVRNLAGRTSEEVRSTASMMERQNEALAALLRAVGQVDRTVSVDVGDKLVHALSSLADDATAVAARMDEAVTAGTQQTAAVASIAESVSQIDTVVQGTAAESEAFQQASLDVRERSESLSQAINQLSAMIGESRR